mgnify:CR=1 FL=1
MKNIFTDHPKSVDETYFQHMKAALFFAYNLFTGAIACIIHAFFPFLFVHTAGKKVHYIVKYMKATGRWEGLEKLFGSTESGKESQ